MCNIDPIEAHIQLETALLQAENEKLKTWVKESKTQPTCCVCGAPISNVSVQRMLRTFLWHSRECFRHKPKKIIALERAFGCDIVEVLKITTRRYQNIQAQCSALDISIPYLYMIIRKYCGSDYIGFFVKNSIGKRKETYQKKCNSNKLTYPPKPIKN
jgi:hypothetical protein